MMSKCCIEAERTMIYRITQNRNQTLSQLIEQQQIIEQLEDQQEQVDTVDTVEYPEVNPEDNSVSSTATDISTGGIQVVF